MTIPFLATAIDALVNVVQEPDEIRRLAAQAGIDSSFIDWGGTARVLWYRALVEAQRRGKLGDLLDEVLGEYPVASIEFVRLAMGERSG